MKIHKRGALVVSRSVKGRIRHMIEEIPSPKNLIIPLYINDYFKLSPVVSLGDNVKKGQIIAKDPSGEAVILSSVSGKILSIVSRELGRSAVDVVIIENDFLETAENPVDENEIPNYTLDHLGGEEILEKIRRSGIIDTAVATFPLAFKIEKTPKTDVLVIDALESEPYIDKNAHLMHERYDEIFFGIEAIMKASGAGRAFFLVSKEDRPFARGLAKKVRGSNIKIEYVSEGYPHPEETAIKRAVYRRLGPLWENKKPPNLLIIDLESCDKVCLALLKNEGDISRVVTVMSSALKRRDFDIKSGTSVGYIVNELGLKKKLSDKVIINGLIGGRKEIEPDAALTKEARALFCVPVKELYHFDENSCINCGRCETVCPEGINPKLAELFLKNPDTALLKTLHVVRCRECGSCSYVCPARRSLKNYMIEAKKRVTNND